MATAIGLSHTAVYDRLNGVTQIRLSELEQIAAYLGRPITHFVKDGEAA